MTAVTTAQRKPKITLPANIIAALDDPAWWQPWFLRGDWQSWRSFSSAAFGLPMDDQALQIYRECTGRNEPPQHQVTEAWAICGRRAGKTRVLSTVCAWLGCFVDWREYFAPGECGTIMLLAANRRQARTAMRYLRSLILDHPVLARLVARETEDALELTNRIIIEVQTASFRVTRGYTIPAVICDELAYWLSDEDNANPAGEILDALRPAMATIPGSMMLIATSPYSRKGPVWEAWQRHWAKEHDSILIWKATTRAMNSTVPRRVIDAAMERDPASASAEYMAEFRSDIENYLTREVIEAAVTPGLFEIPPMSGTVYSAFTDPSGGSQDSFTLGIAHRDDNGHGILDCVRERRVPFSPDAVVEEFAAVLKSYGVTEVVGDRYAGEWPRERFNQHGITYEPAERPKSDLYRDFLPIINSGRCELLDNARMVAQLVSLERRTARGGRDSIDHPPGAHDDLANVCAGAIVQVAGEPDAMEVWVKLNR
jgi:hypothetical protein